MNIDELFTNKEHLDKEILFYTNKKQIRTIKQNKELVEAHIKKARHNIAFYTINKNNTNFNDWLIVILYYSLYHCALALITKKQYSSKNHYATILLLIKEYAISKEEAQLIKELSINKEDAKLYTNLKEDRHNASYHTNTLFNKEKMHYYEDNVLDFMNKTEALIK